MLPLLFALLFSPFEFQTPSGFIVQHNGVQGTMAVIEESYQRTADQWNATVPLYRHIPEAAPRITRIVYFPMTMEGRLCQHTIRFAVVDNGGLRGYTIVIGAGVKREELPQTLDAALWRLFLVSSWMERPSAWTAEGCLD